jgi:type VI secretion system protein VasI
LGRFLKWAAIVFFLLGVLGILIEKVQEESVAKPGMAKDRQTSTVSRTGEWKIERDRSSFDDSPTVTLSLKALKPVSGWPGKIEFPVMVLRCREHKTEAYIRTNMVPNVEYGHASEATVRLRLDEDPATKVLASESTDHQALFFRDPIPFVRSILKHQELLFGFTPFNSPAVETVFFLDGLSEAIKPLREACHW